MFCPYCGTQHDEGAATCQLCGARLPNRVPQANAWQAPPQVNPGYQQPPQQGLPRENVGASGYVHPRSVLEPQSSDAEPLKKPRRKAPALPEKLKHVDFRKFFAKNSKLMMILAGAAAVVLVVILVLSLLGGGSGSFHMAVSGTLIRRDWLEEETFVYQGGELVLETGEISYGEFSSLDGTIQLFCEGGELILLRSGEEVTIDEEVHMYRISANGKFVVYTNLDQELYLYDVEKDDARQIGEDAALPVISPDGRTVCYTSVDGRDMAAYIFTGKKSQLLIEDMYVIGVANGGDAVYCADEDDTLYVVDSKGEKEKIASQLSSDSAFFNSDCTELIFQSDGKMYIWNGREKTKLSGKEGGLLLQVPGFCGYTNSMGVILGVDSFAGHYYTCGGTLYYLDSRLESEKVSSHVYDITVSQDGSVFFLDEDSTLFKVPAGKTEPVELAEDVESFVCANDGKAVYFIDDDDTLWYCKGTREPKRIEDDVSDVYMTHDGYALFLVDYRNNSGELFASKNGGKPEEVMDDVYIVHICPDATYLYANYDNRDSHFDVYGTTRGTKFQELD